MRIYYNFMFEWHKQYLLTERSERVRYCFCQENLKIHIFEPTSNVSFVTYRLTKTAELDRKAQQLICKLLQLGGWNSNISQLVYLAIKSMNCFTHVKFSSSCLCFPAL